VGRAFVTADYCGEISAGDEMAILYCLAEEPVKDDQRQDRFLIVEVHTPDRVDDRWVQQAAENAIEDEFGKRLTLLSVGQEEASQYLQTRHLLPIDLGRQ